MSKEEQAADAYGWLVGSWELDCLRWSGNEVVQIGTRFDGTPTRWRFTGITGQSFHWLGEALEPDGKSWRLEGEFRAKRLR